jgi:hypothetical protein
VTGTFVLPPDPGPTSFWEVDAIAPEPLRQGKTIRPKSWMARAFRCTLATKDLDPSAHHYVKYDEAPAWHFACAFK